MLGLLWYDETRRKSLVEVILDAADRYELRFQKPPTLVLVNEQLDLSTLEDLGIRVEGRKNIRPHHVWVTD